MTNEEVLMHHGIKGQRWGVRRFQNEDGSLTPAGKKRLAATKDRTMKVLNVKKNIEKIKAISDQNVINDLKENGIHSAYVKSQYADMTPEEVQGLAERGGYKPTVANWFLGGPQYFDTVAMKQLLKEEMADYEKSHKDHINKAKAYTKQYETLSMADVEALAEEYGYKDAKNQIKSMKKLN